MYITDEDTLTALLHQSVVFQQNISFLYFYKNDKVVIVVLLKMCFHVPFGLIENKILPMASQVVRFYLFQGGCANKSCLFY